MYLLSSEVNGARRASRHSRRYGEIVEGGATENMALKDALILA